MCGIAGVYHFDESPVSKDALQKMAHEIRHRGPDGEGFFVQDKIGLAHRRLAILDRTQRSAQPFLDQATNSALSFNGQIYNYIDLREELRANGDLFQSDGDAEVLLKGLLRFGIKFLKRLDGDFAFAFWHGRERRLYLARDRFGVKPLYFSKRRQCFIFASEIKAILALGVSPQLDTSVISDYVQFRYVQDRQTMFTGIETLRPGEYTEIDDSGMRSQCYWRLQARTQSRNTYAESIEELDDLWTRSVASRLKAEVQIGLLLSGGIDSGFLAHSMRPAPGSMSAITYSVPGELSELAASQEIAARLGYRHVSLENSPSSIELLPDVLRALEEPIGDSIIVPCYELFRRAKEEMTVVMSGEGADEVFGGYAHQQVLKRLTALRSLGLGSVVKLSAHFLPLLAGGLQSKLIPYPAAFDNEAILRGQAICRSEEPVEAYNATRSLWQDLEGLIQPDLMNQIRKMAKPETDSFTREFDHKSWAQVLTQDLNVWLPNYGLVRTDKLSMAHGIECRVPYLNHEFAEKALQLTLQSASGFTAKPKGVLNDLVKLHKGEWSQELLRKSKQPFYLPNVESTEKSLREFSLHYLSSEQTKRHGVFEQKAIDDLLGQPLSFLRAKKLHSILNLHVWMDVFGVTI